MSIQSHSYCFVSFTLNIQLSAHFIILTLKHITVVLKYFVLLYNFTLKTFFVINITSYKVNISFKGLVFTQNLFSSSLNMSEVMF
jgi:hypothetical protein